MTTASGGNAVGRPVLLVGVPGAGTSAVARELATAWGVPLFDTERMTAAALGHVEVATAFVVAGEQAFHEAEVEAALTALAALDAAGGGVLALGSGVLASERVREAVRGRDVVELTVTLAHAAPRLGLATARPVFLGNPRAQWARQAAERRTLYADVATTSIDTDSLTPAEVATAVAGTLAGSTPTTESA